MLFKTQSIKLILPSSTKFYNLYLFHHHTPFISKTKHDLLKNCIKKKEKTNYGQQSFKYTIGQIFVIICINSKATDTIQTVPKPFIRVYTKGRPYH